jgi:hypothetical protein
MTTTRRMLARLRPAARKQRIQFHQNMAMVGGLLFAVLDQPQAHE